MAVTEPDTSNLTEVKENIREYQGSSNGEEVNVETKGEM